MASRPASTFPFLRLPGELRNKIYELCLRDNVTTRHYVFYLASDEPTSENSPPKRKAFKPNEVSPQLLRVNKQIHAEAHSILYQLPIVFHRLNITGLSTINNFMTCIGRERAVVREVAFFMYCSGQCDEDYEKDLGKAFEHFSSCTSLQKLMLCVYPRPPHLAATGRVLVRAAKAWLREVHEREGGWKSTLDVQAVGDDFEGPTNTRTIKMEIEAAIDKLL